MELGIGTELRGARRRLGCTLADAAAETRVRESYLAALEQEDFSGLGGDVYVKGFIASYARFLELDPEPLLVRYREAVDSGAEMRVPSRGRLGDMPGAEPVGQVPGGAIVVLVVVLVVVVVALVVALTGDGDGAGTAARALAPVLGAPGGRLPGR
jgi:cytoskeleton protein RodZ